MVQQGWPPSAALFIAVCCWPSISSSSIATGQGSTFICGVNFKHLKTKKGTNVIKSQAYTQLSL